jgi:hypothetical protein
LVVDFKACSFIPLKDSEVEARSCTSVNGKAPFSFGLATEDDVPTGFALVPDR